jgi:hypothetical protein
MVFVTFVVVMLRNSLRFVPLLMFHYSLYVVTNRREKTRQTAVVWILSIIL